jgi:hypothetical protein
VNDICPVCASNFTHHTIFAQESSSRITNGLYSAYGFSRHDQSMTLKRSTKAGIIRILQYTPEGIEVDSWYVMMGIGQVVALGASPLKRVNCLEKTTWGAFRTEFIRR